MADGAGGFWARIALGFLFRSGRTTAVLSVMVIVAVSALIFLSALAVGVNDAMLRNTVGLFSGHITGSGLPSSLAPKDLMTTGVSGVARRVYLPGILSGGGLGRSLTLCGVDPDAESALTALGRMRVSGHYPEQGAPEIFISRALADDLGISPGSAVRFTAPSLDDPLVLSVSGIYETGIDRFDRGVAFVPRAALPDPDGEWGAAVFLDRGVSPRTVIDAYQRNLGAGTFESWETLMPDLRQLIDLEYASMGIVILLVFGVVSVGIACIFIIFIIKNLREYGIMKAMGVTTREISLLIVLKVGLMNAAACGMGVLIGALAVWGVAGAGGIDISAFTSHNQYFAVSGIISPRLTVFSLLAPPATAFVFSLASAVWPAAMVARRKAADILRMI
jgi:ABC-type lipoprotein release transport system permease subunit